MSDQSPVKKNKKRKCGWNGNMHHSRCGLTQKIQFLVSQNSLGRYNQCFRIYYMHDLLRVLTFHVVYIVCILSKLFISAFSYDYNTAFKLKVVDITVGCKTSSHIHVDEYLISEVLMIKYSSA